VSFGPELIPTGSRAVAFWLSGLPCWESVSTKQLAGVEGQPGSRTLPHALQEPQPGRRFRLGVEDLHLPRDRA
jgi:hypothetical protein